MLYPAVTYTHMYILHLSFFLSILYIICICIVKFLENQYWFTIAKRQHVKVSMKYWSVVNATDVKQTKSISKRSNPFSDKIYYDHIQAYLDNCFVNIRYLFVNIRVDSRNIFRLMWHASNYFSVVWVHLNKILVGKWFSR